MSETITVSGQTPVIDVSTTAGINVFTKETLETAPTTRAWAEVMSMAPGFRPASLEVIGGYPDHHAYADRGGDDRQADDDRRLERETERAV